MPTEISPKKKNSFRKPVLIIQNPKIRHVGNFSLYLCHRNQQTNNTKQKINIKQTAATTLEELKKLSNPIKSSKP